MKTLYVNIDNGYLDSSACDLTCEASWPIYNVTSDEFATAVVSSDAD